MSSNQLYSSLPSARSIRLLHLQPGINSDPITCSLDVINDHALAPEYIALSYCWGNANDQVEVLCNDISIPITRSLHAALCRLRHDSLSQMIWADAICINQKNDPERNQQVSLMRQIYLFASQVTIWAGRGDKSTPSALDMIRSIARACLRQLYGPSLSAEEWLASLRQETDKTRLTYKIRSRKACSINTVVWPAVWAFYNNDWFSRVWVIQEVQGAGDIRLLCGTEEIEWDLVGLAASWICDTHASDPDRITRDLQFPTFRGVCNAMLMWDRSLATRSEAPFTSLLDRTRHFRATDARDRVFALLQHPISSELVDTLLQDVPPMVGSGSSSTTACTHIRIQPDYSMSTFDVFRQVVLNAISCYRNLEVLCYAWQPRRNDAFPSWIPTWDAVDHDYSYTPLPPTLYQAAGNSFPSLLPASNSSILTLQGLNLGSVLEIGTILRLETEGSVTEELGRIDHEKAQLLLLSMVLTQDRWQKDPNLKVSSGRASADIDTHFADFSAYLLPLLEGLKQDSYIPTSSLTCSACWQFIDEEGCAVKELNWVYKCQVCTFVFCKDCHDSGDGCPEADHQYKVTTVPSFWSPYTLEIINVLKAHTGAGLSRRFQEMAKAACQSRVFLQISGGWRGVGPNDVQAGDTLVVLFGARVPFILRRVGSSYRLISDCYVHGLMDGEAMDMWRTGTLEVEDFVIV